MSHNIEMGTKGAKLYPKMQTSSVNDGFEVVSFGVPLQRAANTPKGTKVEYKKTMAADTVTL